MDLGQSLMLIKSKKSTQKDNFEVPPQGVDQLWGVNKNRFFQTFFVDFSCEITEKGLKSTKKVENG